MLHIMICEDNDVQRAHIEGIVNKYLRGDDDMVLTLSTANPAEILENIQAHSIQNGLYFLDIDLQSDIDGFDLATKIKEIDISATIVFITTHSELVHNVFLLRIEAMEYILKDSPPEDIKKRIIECIQTAYQRLLAGKHTGRRYFTAKIGTSKVNTPYDDIVYFESSIRPRNKILLHKVDGELEFYGTVADIANLDSPFFQCHKSFVVNMNYVVRVENRQAQMANGTFIPISRRKITEILTLMG